ncbi:hypothetical protein, conserved [Leishmania tarentolae]|uniref:Uncharacterized protein n=1 Tax=Leishmania tarentolae TaxID=5689 RepID=A0A640K9M5_LEITA|nr:hypothetical protein, conserved [Leishmania tarentolae]
MVHRTRAPRITGDRHVDVSPTAGASGPIRLVEAGTAIAVLLRTFGALLARRVMVSMLAVMLALSLATYAPDTVATSTGGAGILTIGFVVAAVRTAGAAIATALSKEFLLVEDAAALADTLIDRLTHVRAPSDTHVLLPLSQLHFLRSWSRAEVQHSGARRHKAFGLIRTTLLLAYR